MTRLEASAQAIASRIGTRARRVASLPGELAIDIAPDHWLAVCQELRDAPDLAFEQLIDLSGVDYLDYGRSEWTTEAATSSGFSRGVERDEPRRAGDGPRFAVVCQLLSVSRNTRLRIRCRCLPGDPPMIDSLTGIWSSADWYEREAFDLFGILFRGHPDLRRILTDYGFIGHPFRKDFPLIGKVEVRYDPSLRRVVYEPVSIVPRVTVPKVIRKERAEPAPGTGGNG